MWTRYRGRTCELHFLLLWLSSVAVGKEANGIALEFTSTRNRATFAESHSKHIWIYWHELNTPSRFASLTNVRVHARLFVTLYPVYLCTTTRLPWTAGDTGKSRSVSTRLGGSFCRHVAERKTHFLPTGRQQDDMGGPRALSELVSRRLWCIRIRLVNIFMLFSRAERFVPFILMGPQRCTALANLLIRLKSLVCFARGAHNRRVHVFGVLQRDKTCVVMLYKHAKSSML